MNLLQIVWERVKWVQKSSNSNFEKIFVTATVAVAGSIEEEMVYDLKIMDKEAFHRIEIEFLKTYLKME